MSKPKYIREALFSMGPSGQLKYMGIFLCSCGKEFEHRTREIRRGNVRDCGCGSNPKKEPHDLRGTKLWRCWVNMRGRCYNPKKLGYENYGGRGIKVSPLWRQDFKAFYDYVVTLPGWNDPLLSLDRIENDRDYEPGNLRWATRTEQNTNKRK